MESLFSVSGFSELFNRFGLMLKIMTYFDYWDLAVSTFMKLNKMAHSKIVSNLDIISREMKEKRSLTIWRDLKIFRTLLSSKIMCKTVSITILDVDHDEFDINDHINQYIKQKDNKENVFSPEDIIFLTNKTTASNSEIEQECSSSSWYIKHIEADFPIWFIKSDVLADSPQEWYRKFKIWTKTGLFVEDLMFKFSNVEDINFGEGDLTWLALSRSFQCMGYYFYGDKIHEFYNSTLATSIKLSVIK